MNSIFSKKWWRASAVRSLKTFAQTAVALITVGSAVTDVDWIAVLSVSATAAVASLLTSIGGLPEVE